MPKDFDAPHALNLTAEEVSALIYSAYGVHAARLTPMQSELSAVYRADLVDGRKFAFKALHYTPDAFQASLWRVNAMELLHHKGIPTGRTLISVEGQALQPAQSSLGKIMMHMGEWLDGEPLEDVDATENLMRAVGASSANVALLLQSFPKPPVCISHPWELTRTGETLAESLPSIQDQSIRNLVEAASDRFHRNVEPHLASLPHAVVHHDLHDSNLLVDSRSYSITGVLDFGDMVWGPRVAELAVTAAYGGRAAADPIAAYLQIVDGWGTLLPISRPEAEVLLDASVARLAVNLSVWNARGTSDRGDYARSRSVRSERTLRALLLEDSSRLTEQICRTLVSPERVR